MILLITKHQTIDDYIWKYNVNYIKLHQKHRIGQWTIEHNEGWKIARLLKTENEITQPRK